MNPDVDTGRRREQIIGGVVVAVGLVVAVLSVIALFAAGDGPASDVAGPDVTLPASASASANPSATASASSSTTAGGAPTGAPATPTTAVTSSSAGAGTGTAAQPLVVLNNTSDAGLAAQAAAQFTAGGWTVTSTGNFQGDILSTCAYYDPSVPGAQQAAEALQTQFPAIQRTKERFGGLPAGPVVVVLTSDYTAQ